MHVHCCSQLYRGAPVYVASFQKRYYDVGVDSASRNNIIVFGHASYVGPSSRPLFLRERARVNIIRRRWK